MQDDRTAFESAAGLSGQGLAEYRAVKLKFRLNDPEFSECPECGRTVLQLIDNKKCSDCCQRENDKARIAKASEKKAAKAASALVDQVKAANGTGDGKWGAERACPND